MKMDKMSYLEMSGSCLREASGQAVMVEWVVFKGITPTSKGDGADQITQNFKMNWCGRLTESSIADYGGMTPEPSVVDAVAAIALIGSYVAISVAGDPPEQLCNWHRIRRPWQGNNGLALPSSHAIEPILGLKIGVPRLLVASLSLPSSEPGLSLLELDMSAEESFPSSD
ncbi:hypothetical protein HAX54_038165 [Datura stramonium]|uniref:Uncharacterized protein n=1 Tax=Datura stramonium TaxID=4076 RepID=A0ABS8VKX5_DATST|nr:hypothetical protein [Datura stramonium]